MEAGIRTSITEAGNQRFAHRPILFYPIQQPQIGVPGDGIEFRQAGAQLLDPVHILAQESDDHGLFQQIGFRQHCLVPGENTGLED